MDEINKRIEQAKILTITKQFDEAIKVLNSCKNDKNGNWEVFFELGKIYYIKRQFFIAVKNLKYALKLNKNNIHIKFLLAKTFKELNLKFRALKLFFDIRKSNFSMQQEIDNEIISMFMKENLYFVTLKYIDKYVTKSNVLREKILNYLFAQIDILNFKESSEKAKILAINTLKKIRNLNVREKNILLNEIEIADNKLRLKSLPRILEIELTQNCNLKCKMCPNYSKTGNYKELNEEQISILVDLLEYAETIIWIGGEPLLYKNIEKLFDIANKLHVKQEIVTNGLLLTKKIIKKIIDYNIKLTLSIDSVNKDIYEKIRFGGSFNTLLKNIKYIYEYRCLKKSEKEFVINVVLSRWNYEYKNNFFEIVNFANKYNFKTINIYFDSREHDKILQKKYIKQFNLQRKDLIKLANDFGINLDINFEYLNENTDKDKVNKNFLCKFCLLPWKKIYIRFNGDVNIDCRCPKIGDFSKNIRKEYLINNIWNGRKMINFRRQIINEDLESIKKICNSDISLRKG